MATSPRRIDRQLLARAESSAALFHRSGTEQLEHWATLGAAVEAVLGLRAVGTLKAVGSAADIDSLISRVGTPSANRKLARYLKRQAFPQYGAAQGDGARVLTFDGKSARRSGLPSRKPPAATTAGR